MAAATYLSRALTLVLLPGAPLPGAVLRALRYVPVGVLAALVVSLLPAAPGQTAAPATLPELLAAGLTAAVAIRSRGTLWPVVAGVAAVSILRRLMG